MLEDDLKAALRPVDPPAGFEQRVLARLGDPGRGNARQHIASPGRFTAWAAAAGMAFASIGGIAIYRHQQEQRRGLEARDQLLLALQITGKKLDAVRNRINTNEAQTKQ